MMTTNEIEQLLDAEAQRVKIVQALQILDTPPEQSFDDVVELVSDICETPNVMIGFMDSKRKWFKAKLGVDLIEIPRNMALCAEAIFESKPLLINDTWSEQKYKNHPMVQGTPNIRFYASLPLLVDGCVVGALSLFDRSPREITQKQLRFLQTVTNQVMSLLSARYLEKRRQEAEQLLDQHKLQMVSTAKFSALGEMASGIAHEIMTPLAVIAKQATDLNDMVHNGQLDLSKMKLACTHIKNTTQRIAKTVRGLRAFAREDEHEAVENVTVKTLIEDTLMLSRDRFKGRVDLKVETSAENELVSCRPVQITQVLLNLLFNGFDAALEHTEKWVKLEVTFKSDTVEFAVTDSGPGIPLHLQEKIMEPFFTTKPVGKGTGIGLSISKRILHVHESDLQIDNGCPNTKFTFQLKRITTPTLLPV